MYRHPPSPTHRPTQGKDETHLPKGECRYLLLHPEVRGQRCACVGFSLNKATPGSSCDCGHGACYHIATVHDCLTDTEEIEALKERVKYLEELLARERYGARNNLMTRLNDLEELVDKYKIDMESEVKTAYRGIEGLWHNVGTLQRRARYYDDRIDALIDANQASRDDIQALQKRVIELDDSSMLLEERLGILNTSEEIVNPDTNASLKENLRVEADSPAVERNLSSGACPHDVWTVHVSLLPKASQPFPFEKDTSAYARCLSRGLHRVVAIPGPESRSFTAKISEEFASVLKGRLWMPLVAKICDAENLCGLPMLRQLPMSKIDENLYDLDFLKKNCAVLDADGRILDLYIAMCKDTLSWHELQQSQTYIGGLEACWDHDPILDGPLLNDEIPNSMVIVEDSTTSANKPSAGDILRRWSPPATRLKRTAAAVSRTSSFDSTDGESKRVKIQGPCVAGTMEAVGRRAEAV